MILFCLGFCYRLIRFVVVRFFYFQQFLLKRPKDLESAVIFGDELLSFVWKSSLKRVVFPYFKKGEVFVELGGLSFFSPITFSSFKGHPETLLSWIRMGLAGGSLKTIMDEDRSGNPRPRLQEVFLGDQKGLLNALGLPGKGVDYWINLFDTPLFNTGVPIGFSVGGDRVSDYLLVFNRLNQALLNRSFPYYFEINLSCPNTENGRKLADDPDQLSLLLDPIRTETDQLISIKLSPDSSNACLQQFVEVVRCYPNMLINIGNTTLRRCIDVGLDPMSISMGKGGLSGEPLFKRTLEMVTLLGPMGVPLMATGGITSFDRVEAVLNQGACLIGVASALVMNPYEVASWGKRL